MKKILIVLLALFVVFAMLGCDSGTPKRTTTTEDDKDKDNQGSESTVIDLGTPDMNGAKNQAYWEIDDEDLLDLLVADGTKIVATFNTAISGGMQLVWQGWNTTDSEFGGWNQSEPLDNNGAPVAGKGAELSSDKKTVTFLLSKAIENYDGFLENIEDNGQVKIFICYYTGTNPMETLVKAEVVEGE